jgi:hypothetical protein
MTIDRILKWFPLALVAFLSLCLYFASSEYFDKRDELVAFQSSIKTFGELAEKSKVEIEAKQKSNLKKVKRYEKQVPKIVSDAVVAFGLRYPAAGSRALPSATVGEPLDDGATRECLVNQGFIKSCAADALKLHAWQDWASLNKIPVEQVLTIEEKPVSAIPQ